MDSCKTSGRTASLGLQTEQTARQIRCRTRSTVPGTVCRGSPCYREAEQKWVVIGNHNYCEDLSREHAALEPWYLDDLAIVVRSFARIYETNLKKQGMLALTFANPADYDRMQSTDRVDILGLETFAPGRNLALRAKHEDGSVDGMRLAHLLNKGQIV